MAKKIPAPQHKRPGKLVLPPAPVAPVASASSCSSQLSGTQRQQLAQAFASEWNAVHASVGSFADEHRTFWGHQVDGSNVRPHGNTVNPSRR
jgi:hypothetical protein